MKRTQLLASFFIGLLLSSQVSFVALAADDAGDTTTPTDQTVVTPTPPPSSDTTSTPAGDGTTTGDQATTPTPPQDPVIPPVTGPATTGPTDPTGADPATTGPDKPTGTAPDWVFNAGTQRWEEADKASFKWDAKSGYWLSPKYYYDTRIGWYEILPPAQAADGTRPDYFITAPQPPQYVSTPYGDLKVGSPEYKTALALGLISDPSIANTGPGSTNTGTLNNNNNGWIDLTTLVDVINTIHSSASSGDANVSGNTTGGSAVTGAANVLVNLLNLLASAWSWSNGNLSYFVQSLFGNKKGDILLNPNASTAGGGGQLGGVSTTSNTGPGSTNDATTNNNNNLNVNNTVDSSITNNVDINAQSGNANVGGNTSGGDAVTGDATAEVNIINLINSFINSGDSFFGVLNIFGNLDGNVLFPDGFLNGLVQGNAASGDNNASNTDTGPGSSNNATVNNNNNANVTNNVTGAFNNNINSAATSGAANTSGNTNAGSATTGDATTSNALFNLTNTSVFGDNAVLVIVNVLGHWVGRIMNVGGNGQSQAALLTGNATVSNNNTGPGSTNNSTVNNNNNLNLNNNVDGTIINNVHADATSGDANVSGNTNGGNATSGKANVATNVANIFGSVLNIKHWFGVLVINVFGDWLGCVNEHCNTTVAGVGAAATPSAPAASPQSALLASHNTTSAVGSAGGTSTASQGSAANTASANLAVKTLAAQNSYEAAAKAHSIWPTLLVIFSIMAMGLAAGLSSLERKHGVRS
jgi:hypothetical protein